MSAGVLSPVPGFVDGHLGVAIAQVYLDRRVEERPWFVAVRLGSLVVGPQRGQDHPQQLGVLGNLRADTTQSLDRGDQPGVIPQMNRFVAGSCRRHPAGGEQGQQIRVGRLESAGDFEADGGSQTVAEQDGRPVQPGLKDSGHAGGEFCDVVDTPFRPPVLAPRILDGQYVGSFGQRF